MNSIDVTSAKLEILTSEFYSDSRSLGEFRQVSSEQVPAAYRRLLDHHSHMTVALEEFHNSPVDLQVLQVHDASESYARELTLSRARDGRTVLYGIMRLKPTLLPADAMADIRAQSAPLGHILIQHNVMREVERLHLWRVQPSERLRVMFGLMVEQAIYGRTALIHCNGQPAIELLEIIALD